jgi:hypothetical protein
LLSFNKIPYCSFQPNKFEEFTFLTIFIEVYITLSAYTARDLHKAPMLHDLLFALVGLPGDVFLHDDQLDKFFVAKDLENSLLQPPEVALLNRIVEVSIV